MLAVEIVVTVALGLFALALVLRSAIRHLPRPAALAVVGLTLVATIAWPLSRATSILRESSAPVPLTDVAYQTSDSCIKCHPSHHRSWARTYHRTMTQDASTLSVQGDFADIEVVLDGGRARMLREGKRFVMELASDAQVRVRDPGLEPGRYSVDRVVGSHEMQVYLTRRADGTYLTLPFEWNLRDGRWVTTTGNFLQPPSEKGLFSHTAEWNSSCAFCHNTRVNPGLQTGSDASVHPTAVERAAAPGSEALRYATTLEELGIACEACHGPGDEHIRRNQNPVRRHIFRITGREDPTIVNPERQAKVDSLETCGRCHGKWFPRLEHLDEALTRGEPFVPGQARLGTLYEDPMRMREAGRNVDGYLWPDGTPRPTSMEYQGVVLSACSENGEMTCGSCHSMHDAPPEDQLRTPEDPATAVRESDSMCVQCHSEFEMPEARQAHSHHPVDALGCLDCHMPFQTFGLMKAVRSHRISVPSPTKTETIGLPNACTQCHVDRPLRWAATHLDDWYGRDKKAVLMRLGDSSSEQSPSTAVELTRGHALTRALAAFALGQDDAQGPIPWRVNLLLDALEDDYAAVRSLAAESLEALGVRHDYDYLALPDERAKRVADLRERLGPLPSPPRTLPEALQALASKRDDRPVVVLE